MNDIEDLLRRIEARSAVVGIIGPERVAAAYPGTTREEIVPRLDARGPKCGNRVVPSVN